MTTKYGDFVEPNFNCRGDPYEDKAKPSDRDTGLAFIATAGKRGKVRRRGMWISRVIHVSDATRDGK